MCQLGPLDSRGRGEIGNEKDVLACNTHEKKREVTGLGGGSHWTTHL